MIFFSLQSLRHNFFSYDYVITFFKWLHYNCLSNKWYISFDPMITWLLPSNDYVITFSNEYVITFHPITTWPHAMIPRLASTRSSRGPASRSTTSPSSSSSSCHSMGYLVGTIVVTEVNKIILHWKKNHGDGKLKLCEYSAKNQNGNTNFISL